MRMRAVVREVTRQPAFYSCVRMRLRADVQEIRRYLQESVLSFYRVGPDETQITKFGRGTFTYKIIPGVWLPR